jgi:PST family polysaccharide transporter
VATTTGQLVALMIGLRFGTMGVIYAYVLYMFIVFVPAIAYAGAPLGIRTGDVLRAVGRQLIGSMTAAAVGFALRPSLVLLPSLERIAILVVAYLATYLFIVVAVFRLTMPLQVCYSVVVDFLPKRWRVPSIVRQNGGVYANK